MFQSIGPTEWVVIGVIVVLLFGGKKIPEFFKGLGEAVREFKKAANEDNPEENKKAKAKEED